MIVFLNGRFIPEAEAKIPPSDRGFTLADGVFDTLLAIDGKPQYGERHFARLLRHAETIRLTIPETAARLMDIAQDLLQRNGLAAGACSVRTTLTRGAGARGLLPPDNPAPTLLMQAAAFSPAREAELAVITARHVRRNEHSPLARIKALGYGDNLAALMEARDGGCADAVLLNTAGNAACGTTGNLFILEGGRLVTPPLADGALDGIARAVIIEQAQAREETIAPDRLNRADGIYLTNSLRGIRAVTILDGRPVSSRNKFFEKMTRDIRPGEAA